MLNSIKKPLSVMMLAVYLVYIAIWVSLFGNSVYAETYTFGPTGDLPESIVVDAAGNMYIANFASNTVTKITPDGTASVFAATGSNPRGISIDGAGNIYVVNYNHVTATMTIPRVTKITPGGISSTLGTTGWDPNDSVIDADGNIYVSNRGDNTVTKITPDGTSSVFGTTGSSPNSLAFDSVGNLYVSNGSDNFLTKIAPDGVSNNFGDSLPQSSVGVVVDSWNNVYVISSSENIVTKILPDGTTTVLSTLVNNPLGIAIDSMDNIYISNMGDNTVTKITPDGTSSVFGTTGDSPLGITVDSVGNVYTTNLGDNTVTKITVPLLAPATPTIAPDLQAASDSGVSSTDNITAITTPSFDVNCSAIGNVITLYSTNPEANTVIASLTCTATGTSTITVTTALAEGVHNITYTEGNAGGTSSGSPALSLTIDSFVPPTIYTLSYTGWLADGGTAPTSQTGAYNSSLTLANNSFTRTGYSANGWDCGASSSGYTLTGNTECTAQFSINQYTLTFNSNGGTAVSPITQDFDSALPTVADPSRTGYTFAGWSSAIPSAMPASDTTLTAQWADSAAPALSLSGAASIMLFQGALFTDPGATWLDNLDGSGSVLAFSGSVNTAVSGTYLLQYRYIDAAGNVSNIVSRTVTVMAAPSSGGGGWGSWRRRDICLSSDLSGDFYDTKCSAPQTVQESGSGSIQTATGATPELPLDTQQPTEVTDPEASEIIEPVLPQIEPPFTKILRKDVKEKTVEYSLGNRFEGCPIIEALNDETLSFQSPSFPDSAISTYADSIDAFAELGIVNGNRNGLFEPKRAITRAEFTKMVLISHCYEYQDEDTRSPAFTDITSDTWEARVVSKAQSLWIISGYSDGTFRPEQLITKAEATKILMGIALIQVNDLANLAYDDLSQDWHKKYVQLGQTLGVFDPEKDNMTFEPYSSVLREDMVHIIHTVVDLYR